MTKIGFNYKTAMVIMRYQNLLGDTEKRLSATRVMLEETKYAKEVVRHETMLEDLSRSVRANIEVFEAIYGTNFN